MNTSDLIRDELRKLSDFHFHPTESPTMAQVYGQVQQALLTLISESNVEAVVAELERYLEDSRNNPRHDWHYIEDRIHQLTSGEKTE